MTGPNKVFIQLDSKSLRLLTTLGAGAAATFFCFFFNGVFFLGDFFLVAFFLGAFLDGPTMNFILPLPITTASVSTDVNGNKIKNSIDLNGNEMQKLV